MIQRILAGALALACTLAFALPAHARHAHHHRQVQHVAPGGDGPSGPMVYDNDGRIRFGGAMPDFSSFVVSTAQHAAVRVGEIVAHPAGCPHVAFCGCGAALEVFGRPVRALWLAAAWLRFPQASPGPGMAAVRQHHVMIIREYLGGNRALVYDANSGGHLTRVHEVSLRGYSVRNPRGG